jgi:hypothetical protein
MSKNECRKAYNQLTFPEQMYWENNFKYGFVNEENSKKLKIWVFTFMNSISIQWGKIKHVTKYEIFVNYDNILEDLWEEIRTCTKKGKKIKGNRCSNSKILKKVSFLNLKF